MSHMSPEIWPARWTRRARNFQEFSADFRDFQDFLPGTWLGWPPGLPYVYAKRRGQQGARPPGQFARPLENVGWQAEVGGRGHHVMHNISCYA